MAVVLPNSTFFHIGRTGGHWVAHVLWRAGLVQHEITPLHITPVLVASHHPEAIRPFSFCFVRHPLHWLASLWRHEMEFGWSGSIVSDLARSDSFPIFVESMLRHWPGGPCWAQLQPFVDACNFVGRTETMNEDLGAALAAAGEPFDRALLDTPRINESSVDRIKRAARAPRELLEAVMAAERPHFERFGYTDVPESLVSDAPAPRLLPTFALKPEASLGDLRHAQETGLLELQFDYRFEDGDIEGSGIHRRMQWALLEAIEASAPRGRCAVMHESDPYFAYIARQAGFDEVVFVCSDRRLVPQRMESAVDADIAIVDYATLMRAPEAAAFDCIILVDGMETTPLSEIDIIGAACLLKPGGRLLMATPILSIDDHAISVKTLWPLGTETRPGQKLAYPSPGYIDRMLSYAGFAPGVVLQQFNEAPNAAVRPHADRLAAQFGMDPHQLLGKAIISTTLGPRPDGDTATLDRIAMWMSRRPIDLLDMSLDALPAITQGTIATLKADLDRERERRERAEQGLAERDRDLAFTRTELAATRIDAELNREQVHQARAAASDYAGRYEKLLLRMQLATPKED